MNYPHEGLNWKSVLATVAIAALAVAAESAVREHAYVLTSAQGASPNGPLVQDSAGNLYGTAQYGGTLGHGSVFEWVLAANGGPNFKVLYSFGGASDGGTPTASLTFDSMGNLYGTTYRGGTNDYGVAFELQPAANGQWNQNVLYSFSGGASGVGPYSALTLDAAGNLYGTAQNGGKNGFGMVFELSPGSNAQWEETALYNFRGSDDGGDPQGNLIFDAAGNLYGATLGIGAQGGSVFELAQTENQGWLEETLYSFNDASGGQYANGGVIFDGAGNLYGVTAVGGGATCRVNRQGCGVAYKLSPSEPTWKESVLYAFGTQLGDGSYPVGSLSWDKRGNLYGATEGDPLDHTGTVFQLHRLQNGSWAETPFHLTKGHGPNAGIIFATSRDLVGTTCCGGAAGAQGVIFDLDNGGFDR